MYIGMCLLYVCANIVCLHANKKALNKNCLSVHAWRISPEGGPSSNINLSLSLSLSIYIYIYIHTLDFSGPASRDLDSFQT